MGYVLLVFPLVPLLYTFEGRTTFLAEATVANLPMTLVSVQRFVAVAPFSSDVMSVVKPVLTVGTPPLYGCLLMLVGRVLHVGR